MDGVSIFILTIYQTTVFFGPYKQYIIICIWAKENATLVSGQYEYSFGDGLGGKWAGYTVLTLSKVLKIGISVSSRGGDPDGVGVSLVVNGVKTNGSIIKPAGKFTHVKDTPEID